MNTAVKTLLWEMWSRNRAVNIVAVVLLPVWVMCFKVFPNDGAGTTIPEILSKLLMGVFIMIPAGFYFIYPVIVANYAQEQAERHQMGFPQRLYSLPLPSWVLATVPMLVCVAGVALACGAMAVAIPDFRDHGYGWWYSLVIITGAVWLMAVSWALAWFRTLQVVVLYGILLLLFCCGVMPFESESRFWSIFFVVLTPLLLVSGWVLALVGVAADRYGALWNLPSAEELRERLRDRIARREGLAGFRSSAEAQGWFESRWVVPLLWVVAFIHALPLGVYLLEHLNGSLRLDPQRDFMIASYPFMLPTLVIAFAAGMVLARNGSQSTNMDVGPLQATRPLSDAALVRIKLKAGATGLAKVVALSTVLLCLVTTILRAWPGGVIRWQEAAPTTGGRFLVAGIALGLYLTLLWTVMSNAMTLLLTNSRRVILTVSIVGGCVLFLSLLAVGGAEITEYQGLVRQTRIVRLLLAVAVALAGVWCFGTAIARRLVTARSLLGPTAIWFSLVAVFTAVGWGHLSRLGTDAVAFALVLAVLPVLPLAAAPLAMHRNRHRS